MPTPTGAETIGERLIRLRTELARVRQTIARSETNGADAMMGMGTRITQIAYERAIERERDLVAEISALEGRLSGSAGRRLAVTRTSQPNC